MSDISLAPQVMPKRGEREAVEEVRNALTLAGIKTYSGKFSDENFLMEHDGSEFVVTCFRKGLARK